MEIQRFKAADVLRLLLSSSAVDSGLSDAEFGRTLSSLVQRCSHLGNNLTRKQSGAILQGEQQTYERNQTGVSMVNVSIKWPLQLQK